MSENAIYSLLGQAMGEIGAIGKDQYNQQQRFNYRGVDDVMNALNPILVKYGLFVVPEVVGQVREERESKSGANLIYSIVTMKYTVFAPDGSNISATVIGEGMDMGDKATNKAMSVAFKYAMFQLFCIPTKEMIDPDGESHETRKRKADTFQAVDSIKQFCDKHGLTGKEFKEMQKGVADRVPSVPYSEMTFNDYMNLISAIRVTYKDRLQEKGGENE